MSLFLTGCVKAKLAITNFFEDHSAVTAIEYAILAVAVSAIVYAVFGGDNSALKGALTDAMSKVTSNIDKAAS